MLLDRTERQNSSRSNIERHCFEINGARDLPASFQAFVRPEVVPTALRKIDGTRGRCFLNDWCDENLPSPQILVLTRNRDRIFRIMQPEGAHYGHTSISALA